MTGFILVTIIFAVSMAGVLLAMSGKITYTKKKSRAVGLAVVLALLAVTYYATSCAIYIQTAQKMFQYQEKKTYIETYTQKNGRSLNDTLDQVALQVMKEQQNEWRIEAQTNYRLYGNWIILPEEIRTLEEIK